MIVAGNGSTAERKKRLPSPSWTGHANRKERNHANATSLNDFKDAKVTQQGVYLTLIPNRAKQE